MKILHVLDHSLPVMSGYSTRSRNIVIFQRQRGWEPIVLTSPKHPLDAPPRETLEGISHYRTPTARGPRRPYVDEVQLIRRLRSRIVEIAAVEGVSVIHAHSPALNGVAALRAARRRGCPLVYESRAFWEDAAVDHGTTTEGSLRYRLTRALESYLFRRADRVVVIAEAMRGEITRRGVDPRRITVVPNGVDTEWFRPTPRDPALTQALGLRPGCVLGFVGSFYHYEGLQFLVEAFPALRARIPDLQLLLVGGGAEEATLRSKAPAGSGIIFAGQVPYDRVRDYYAQIDVFVCPRRRMRLTELVTPLKPLEAMAMGMTVLASDVGGQAELVTHDRTGLLFRAESVDSLIEQVLRAADADCRRRLGAAAREFVVEERRWPQVVARYAPLYGAGAPLAPALAGA
jgi:PEP-CTERM/exosortase A-associated glycosyltransferase